MKLVISRGNSGLACKYPPLPGGFGVISRQDWSKTVNRKTDIENTVLVLSEKGALPERAGWDGAVNRRAKSRKLLFPPCVAWEGGENR